MDAVRIFKHPLVVYRDVYDNDKVWALLGMRSIVHRAGRKPR